MRRRCVQPEDVQRTNRESEQQAGFGSTLGHGRIPSGFRTPQILALFAILFLTLIPCSHAVGKSSGGTEQSLTPRAVSLHATRDEPAAARLHSFIAAVRFNHRDLGFDTGVTVGPEPGDLEIQFASFRSANDRLLYRLIGSDKEWREVTDEHHVLYRHLAPGHYELDFQRAASSGLRGSTVETLPIYVLPQFWATARFRTLSIAALLLLILLLYKLRVGDLVRHNKELHATVTQTRAELILAAELAGDARVALKEQALRDSLTGLWNRRAIFSMLEKEVCRAQRDRLSITLIMIDLDHFKSINDTYGHLTGDDVLREVSGRLVELMRPYDFAGRYGGEEFLVVLPSCSLQNGVQRAEAFLRAVAGTQVSTAAGALAVTCSLGVAAFDDSMNPEDLIHQADAALYQAKRRGRNCVCAGNPRDFRNPGALEAFSA